MGAFLTASKLKEVVPGLTQSCTSTTNKDNKYTVEMLSSTFREQVTRYYIRFNRSETQSIPDEMSRANRCSIIESSARASRRKENWNC